MKAVLFCGGDRAATGQGEAMPRCLRYQRPVQLTCAQLLVVIEVTVLGSLAKRFQAVQQASTMAS